ncbi:MAG: hypothetical protein JW730_18275 [Anaerolineales bacterium]|nr:hypothetical protein [Anaerolineales bacterium]
MRLLSVIILLGILCVPCIAQDLPNQLVTAYIGFDQNSQPQLFGGAAYAKQVSGPFFSYSGYDVTPLLGETSQVAGMAIPKLKYSGYTGFSVRWAQIGDRLSFWSLATGGIASTGGNTSGTVGVGSFGHVALGRGWGLIMAMQVSHDGIVGTSYVPRIGITYGSK